MRKHLLFKKVAVVNIQQPDIVSLSGNMKEFILQSASPVDFKLYAGSVATANLILSETYYPSSGNNRITINVTDVIQGYLETVFPTSDRFVQPNMARMFVAEYDDHASTFIAVNGGIRGFTGRTDDFLMQHFLTWQPQEKAVTFQSPEWLTLYATQDIYLVFVPYYDDRAGDKQTIVQIQQGVVLTQNMSCRYIYGITGKIPSAYDVWTEDTNGTRISYVQRYYVSDRLSQTEGWYSFINTLGGIDTIRAYGELAFNPECTYNLGEINGNQKAYRIDTDRLYTRNTGYQSPEEAEWLQDLFMSKQAWHHVDETPTEIVITEVDATYTTSDLPSTYTFSYKYAQVKDAGYLNIRRKDLPTITRDLWILRYGIWDNSGVWIPREEWKSV
ncbi:MAG: hypothetical protein LUE98_04585 [Tannerellaceae bacterium]|nr:hypothetical protein [Tannerellaceae bacterium]